MNNPITKGEKGKEDPFVELGGSVGHGGGVVGCCVVVVVLRKTMFENFCDNEN